MNPETTEAERQAAERALGIRCFDETELRDRVERARRQIEEHRLDALLLSDEPNVIYFTGMETPSFATRARPLFVLIPADGPPVLFCSRSQSANARAASAIEEIVSFEGFEPEAIAALAEKLRERRLATGRIGCEIGPEQRLGMTFNGFERLRAALPEAELCDGSAAIWGTRAVKSAAEIDLMRRAGEINGSAFAAALEAARAGVSEREVRRVWAATLTDLGADRPGYFAVHSGPGSYRRVSSSATARTLADGDLLWMDGGLVNRGYWSDVTRMIAIGRPTASQRDDYAFAWGVVQELIAGVRPGCTAGDVARRAAELFAAAGLPMGSSSRNGHGLGLELTEPPSIVDGDETVLLPGMTISVETGVARWEGYFMLEDNFVVGENGAELLSVPAPPTLPEAS
jgi:Xaa-Pro dipeptidase